MYTLEHSSKLDLDSFAELICLDSVAQPFGLSFAYFTLKKSLEWVDAGGEKCETMAEFRGSTAPREST